MVNQNQLQRHGAPNAVDGLLLPDDRTGLFSKATLPISHSISSKHSGEHDRDYSAFWSFSLGAKGSSRQLINHPPGPSARVNFH